MADQLRDLLTRIVSRERHRGTVLLDAEDLCAIETALAQAEPVAFNPAEALRLAEEFAQMKQAHGVFCNADSRRLMEEARRALAAYLLGIKEDGND